LQDTWQVVLLIKEKPKHSRPEEECQRHKLRFIATCEYNLTPGAIMPFKWKISIPFNSWRVSGCAKIVYRPKNNYVPLKSLYENVAALKLDKSAWDYNIEAQPYAYRSRKSILLRKERRLQREFKSFLSRREAKKSAHWSVRDRF
jgi:hypothetical protein